MWQVVSFCAVLLNMLTSYKTIIRLEGIIMEDIKLMNSDRKLLHHLTAEQNQILQKHSQAGKGPAFNAQVPILKSLLQLNKYEIK